MCVCVCVCIHISNRLIYQAISSTHTQSQPCTATPISLFVQCQAPFRLLPSSVTTLVLIEVCLKQSHECSGMNDTHGINQ